MSDRTAKIKEALGKLDRTNDDDWTQAGLPDMSRMKELTGFEDLKRDEVAMASPDFERGSNPADDNGQQAADNDADNGGRAPVGSADTASKTELDEANERRDPNLDPATNPNVGKTDLGPYEGQTHTADQGEKLAETLADEGSSKEPSDIAASVGDPIALIEAAMIAMNADERYRKNGELQAFMRHYMLAQVNIKAHQERLNKRHEDARASPAG